MEDNDEGKMPEMTFWGPEGGKMPVEEERLSRSTPFWLTGLFTDPRAVFKSDLEEGSIIQALVRVAGGLFVVVLLFFLIIAFLFEWINSMRSEVNVTGSGGNTGVLLAGLGVFVLVIYPLAGIIMFLLWNAVLYIIARILGGSGAFGKQASLLSIIILFQLVLGVLLVPFEIVLAFIPCIGGVIGMLVPIGLGLYFIYLETIAISIAHKMDVLRSFIVIITPILLIMGLYIGVILAAIDPYLSAIPSQGGANVLAGGGRTLFPGIPVVSDASECEKVGQDNALHYTVPPKDLCYTQFAINNKQASACAKVSHQGTKDACYMETAVLLKDSQICSSILDSKIKANCHQITGY